MRMQDILKKYGDYLVPAGILIISLIIYGTLYGHPKAMFQDNSYYIASAQKHIADVLYMEPHPPLGKMLMAVGEVLVGANNDINQQALNVIDYLTGHAAPAGMQYSGFRLPS